MNPNCIKDLDSLSLFENYAACGLWQLCASSNEEKQSNNHILPQQAWLQVDYRLLSNSTSLVAQKT